MKLCLSVVLLFCIVYQGLPATINPTNYKDCGIKTNKIFPWHAALYRNELYICGGTVINPTTVMTAAHCFISDNSNSSYTIAVGNLERNWKHTKDAGNAQYKTVKDITIPARYRGHDANYANDIALVTVDSAFEYTNYVRPVCVDLSKDEIPINVNGYIPKWSPSEDVQMLTHVSPNLISIEKCFQEVPDSYRPFITNDKFCGNFKTGYTTVCPGDGGSSLTILENGRHFMKGVTSNSPQRGSCVGPTTVTFTSLAYHAKWIQEHIEVPSTVGLPPGPPEGGQDL